MFGATVKPLLVSGAAVLAILAISGCRAGGLTPMPGNQTMNMSRIEQGAGNFAPDVSILKKLKKQIVIGSTVDPDNGAQNPYGLTVAPITSGKLTKGDLVICDFNAKSNVQGTGKSIIALHPDPKSEPIHISSIHALLGCDALALDLDDTIWASVMVANDNPVLDANGKLISNISGKPFKQPWGQVLVRHKSTSFFYESNAGTGSIVRIKVGSKFSWETIATGFPVNHGKPGTALAPSGLAYDSTIDTLYFADGMNNTIVAFKDVSKIPKDGIKAIRGGLKFKGPAGADARVVFAGKPLNGPISTALLPNGNLVVGNTLDPNGKNLLIEISAGGKLLDVRNVDKGAAGSLFGLVATGKDDLDTKIYFNDDNDNNLQVLER
jgi:hypothetical protein